MKRLSIIYGARGLLGRHLVAECKRRGNEVLEINTPVDRIDEPTIVHGAWYAQIFNATGLASVDQCEKHPDEAFRVNALAPQLISRLARELGLCVVHLSTEFVFDGNTLQPGHGHFKASEAHAPTPWSIYAQSKRYGEILTAQENSHHKIVRLQHIYGDGGRNFLSHLMTGKLKEAGLDDRRQIAPMWAGTAARLIYDIAQTPEYGVWHVATRNTTDFFNLGVATQSQGAWHPAWAGGGRPSIHLQCRRWEMNQMDDLPTWEESYEAFKASR